MSKKLMAFSHGEYTFQESEVENQFYFYRKDRDVLGDVGNIPMEFYQAYIRNKMFSGEIAGMVANNICFENSMDGKYIRITATPIGEEPELNKKKRGFFKRLLGKK